MLPALIALGGGSLLAAGSAAALQLGELRVESSLGQPLRASIAYALNPNEHIQDHCIRLGSSATGLPAIRNARVSLGRDVIRLTGRVPVNDPVIALSLALDCPGTPRLSREYTAFVDPATAAASAKARAAATSARPEDGISGARDAAAGNSAGTPTRPVASGTYRVQPGDSLSGIAARITGRRMRLWDTVDALFVANPEAFINGNRDLLQAGSQLVIPAAVLEPGAGVAASAHAAQPAPSAAEPAPQEEATPVPLAQEATPAAEAREATSAVPGEQSGQTNRAGAAASEPAIAEPPRQGDVSLGADGPFVSPIEATADSPAAAPVEPAAPAAARAPAANPAASSASPSDASSRAWLMWLGGSGAALILALVLFGRQLKERFGSAAQLAYGRRGAEAGRDTTVVARVDLDASSLDVDLDDAGRLDDSGNIDLAQEFGYAMPGDTGSREDPFGSTAILESEILPSDETGEYDLSMILDATQQKLPDAEDTTKDLRAIQLDEDKGEQADGDYTLSRDVDYKILDQDYRDEMTATQALNAELARAALDMSLDIEIDDATSVLPAQAGDEDLVDPEALSADVDNASASTVEMRPGGSASGADAQAADEHEDTRTDEDLTSTMSDAENDPTAQTDETKKLRVS